MSQEKVILERVYAAAKANSPSLINKVAQEAIDVLVHNCEKNRGVLSVCLTLMLKKIISPEQDVRLHQTGMQGGFSARGMDSKFVTPFLREKHFPYMASGAGALTRSLEQAVPYDKNYTGKISPSEVRVAFLACVNEIQNDAEIAEDAMQYFLHGLIQIRDRDRNIQLIKPKDRSIAVVVEKIGEHFASARQGGSRLPVLAIYAVYKQMISEVGKYREFELCELQSHTSADQKSGFLGDIQINDAEGKPVEVVEVKHGVRLTPQLVADCYDKFKTVPGVRTYYLLSTNERIDRVAEISELTMKIHRNHGCQMIVNGIQSTLRYYLRLIRNPDNFLDDYVQLVEQECNYEIKMLWSSLWDGEE